ncbi:MAG: hypothetical protein ACPGID_01775 [Rubricella sp.]
MLTRLAAAAAIALSVTAFGGTITPASAQITYNTGQPMLFVFRTQNGNWTGCGPVQCLWTNYGNKAEVFDLLTQDRHGRFDYIGNYGSCEVYQSPRGLESWDRQPDTIASDIQRRC